MEVVVRCRGDGWLLTCPAWQPSPWVAHPKVNGACVEPTARQRERVGELLQQEMARLHGANTSAAVDTLRAVLLRVGVVEPKYERLESWLAAPPSTLWFLVGERRTTPWPLDAALDATLLDDATRGLEASDLLASVARSILGESIDEVVAALSASDHALPFSRPLRDRLSAEGVACPSRLGTSSVWGSAVRCGVSNRRAAAARTAVNLRCLIDDCDAQKCAKRHGWTSKPWPAPDARAGCAAGFCGGKLRHVEVGTSRERCRGMAGEEGSRQASGEAS